MQDDSLKQYRDDRPKPICGLQPMALRPLPSPIDPRRARLIRNSEKKWVNGSVLHYHFLQQWQPPSAAEDQRHSVRSAFAQWKELGMGLEFREVQDPAEAEIRIGFDHDDGSWSYVGRDAIDHAPDPAERTLNYGWDLTDAYGYDTAMHEVGHVLGFPHEHQNPNAGIVWDEPTVYAHFAGPPNHWGADVTFHNIIRKLDAGEVQGSSWDKNSIMHYRFAAGLIQHPSEYQSSALWPQSGLSQVDEEEARRFYPALSDALPELAPWQLARIDVQPGEQLNWLIRPVQSRTYTLRTLGALDTVMVLFENIDGEPRYLDGDDDSGSEQNALLQPRLVAGREYILRLRLYSANAAGGGGLVMY